MGYRLFVLLLAMSLSGCFLLPGGSVVDSAMVVHTAGSAQSTISARVPAEARKVYEAFTNVVDGLDDIEILSRKDAAMMIEVAGDFGEIIAQVTTLDSRESLLYIWADASGTGRLGSDVANGAVEAICDELGVSYKRIEY